MALFLNLRKAYHEEALRALEGALATLDAPAPQLRPAAGNLLDDWN